MSKTYKKCDEDFKKTLVALYESGKRISDLEREYGINESTIRAWVKKYGTITTSKRKIAFYHFRYQVIFYKEYVARFIGLFILSDKIDSFLYKTMFIINNLSDNIFRLAIVNIVKISKFINYNHKIVLFY